MLLVLGAGLLWGSVGPAQVLAGPGAPPVALGGARVLLGGLVLAGIVLATTPRAYQGWPRASWPPLLAATAATTVFQAAFLTSVARTGAALATAVTFGIVPVATGAVSYTSETCIRDRRWIGGTACAVLGCALVTAPAGADRVDLVGVAFAVLSGGCFGVYTVSAKLLTLGRVSMPAAVSVTLLVGGVLLAPWTLAGLPALTTARSLALVAWLGPITAALAYWFFVTGLRRVTAATAGTLSLAEPLVATALAVLVLHERMSARVTAGLLVLLGGLVVVSLPGRRGRTRREQTPGPAEPAAQVPRSVGRDHWTS